MWSCGKLYIVLLLVGFAAASPFVSSKESRNDAPISYRLPNDTRPITYEIHLTTNVHRGDRKFTGVVIIDFEVVQTTKTVVVQARQLNITSASLSYPREPTQEFSITTSYDNVTEFFTVESVGILLPGEIYKLKIDYEGNLRTDDWGFYIQSYKNTMGQDVYLAATQFEATEARHAFPCYDEPNKKSIFRIKITHGNNYNAISNMPVISTTPNNDGTTTTVFEPTTLMSPSVVGWTVSDFIYTEKVDRIPIRIYSKPNFENQHKFALETAIAVFNTLIEYTQVDYPLPKIDNVAVPNKIGGMENWGMLAYGERFLLYNENETTTAAQTGIASVITHEFTHQWFGNLVGFGWWEYSWMKESFASLMESSISDKVYPDWDLMQVFITRYYRNTLNYDARVNPRPLTQYVESPDEILGYVFDLLPYGKGASLMRMIQHVFTEETYRKALIYYLKEMKYTTVKEDDFFRALKVVAMQDNFPESAYTIETWLKSWTRQGGYPLVTVTRDYDKGTITISQEPFDGTNNTNIMDKRSWWVPFNFATASNPDFDDTRPKGNIPPGTSSVTIGQENEKWTSKDWIIFNKQETSFYRVNYDSQNWQLIAQGLRDNMHSVHRFNRAFLLENSFQLARANRLSYDVVFNLMTYMKNETEFAPWLFANSIYSEFDSKLWGNPEYKTFRFFFRKITENFYKQLTIDENANDPHLIKQTRSSIIDMACATNNADCLEAANKKLREVAQEGRTIEPNLRSTIFCTGMMNGTELDLRLGLQLLPFVEDSTMRNQILMGIACLRNQDVLKKYLEVTLDAASNLKPSERTRILDYIVSKGLTGVKAAIEFLIINHEAYMKISADSPNVNLVLSAVRSISNQIYNKQDLTLFEGLLEEIKNDEGITTAQLDTIRAAIQKNLEWTETIGQSIVRWTSKFYEENGGKEEEGGSGEGDNGTMIAVSTSVLAFVALCFLQSIM